MTEYNAPERKAQFRDRMTREVEVVEVGKRGRGSLWVYETPTGRKHLWLHFDRNYDWWKVCSRPRSADRFQQPVIHAFLGPKRHQFHVVPHEDMLQKFTLSKADEQIQVHRTQQPALFNNYRSLTPLVESQDGRQKIGASG
jgi:hypothetical protein